MTARKTPSAIIDSTAAFATLDSKIDGIKDDLLRELGGAILRLTQAVETLSNGVVRRDVMSAELQRRDEAIKRAFCEITEMKNEQEIRDERASSLRNGLIVTAFGAILSLALGLATMFLNNAT